jgi:FKBP-type peptidyl-prolyl cis-trans isomerase SlyD
VRPNSNKGSLVKISKDSVVSIHYTLTDDNNQTLDSSDGGDPLVYLHGAGNIIPGLEEALEGRKQGDKFKVTIAPENAYGIRDEEMIQTIPKSQFPDTEELDVGMSFQAHSPEGPVILTVVEVKDKDVVVDGNHPLAGTTLHFDVNVQEVRKATEEELEHGHVHGEGGHHH